MKKKTFLVYILAASMIFSLSGCRAKLTETEAATATSSETESETSKETETEKKTVKQSETEKATEKETEKKKEKETEASDRVNDGKKIEESTITSGLGSVRTKLFAADSRLHIGNLKIVSEMAVNIFMVIALRKLAVLTVIPMTAEIISARRTDTVSSPISVA